LIPKEGVYAVRVSFENSTQVAGIKNRPRNEETLGHDKLFVSNLWPCIPYVYDGVANVGENPTFGEGHMNYEVHIFGFDRDIIGRGIRLHFIDRIRDEKRFSGARELEDQIQKDKEKALQILRKRNDPLYL
jgi:FAD synthase